MKNKPVAIFSQKFGNFVNYLVLFFIVSVQHYCLLNEKKALKYLVQGSGVRKNLSNFTQQKLFLMWKVYLSLIN